MNIIESTGILSLIVQFLTAIVDFYSLSLTVPTSYNLIRELVIMELIVQMIEGSFYIWMITNFNAIKNITPFRYYDVNHFYVLLEIFTRSRREKRKQYIFK